MDDVTRILNEFEEGDRDSSSQLLPLVYNELRKLAAARLRNEKPGQTLQATGLVHEAYLKLVDVDRLQAWDSRAHFFAAAAEAMRRILIEAARRKQTVKRGGDRHRIDISEVDPELMPPSDDLLALNEAIDDLANQEPKTADLVKLRYFAGFTNIEAAELLSISPRHADNLWAFAKAWLHERIHGENS